MSPQQIITFIAKTNLGYVLGNAVKSIMLASEEEERQRKIQHLKDARLFLNVEIKRLGKEK